MYIIAVLAIITAVSTLGCVSGGEKGTSISPSQGSSVDSPYKETIKGTWFKINDDGSAAGMAFGENGNFVLAGTGPDGKVISTTGKYRFVSSNRIEMAIPVSDKSEIYTRYNEVVSVTGKELVLRDEDGATSTLMKAPEK